VTFHTQRATRNGKKHREEDHPPISVLLDRTISLAKAQIRSIRSLECTLDDSKSRHVAVPLIRTHRYDIHHLSPSRIQWTDVVGLEPGDGPVREDGPVPGVGGDGYVREVGFDPGSLYFLTSAWTVDDNR
jgi:hypothetical protein